ncbi:hypothetical protein RCV38_17925 [Escherichia coli]|uniref:hypothetical protein n=1 Tax=Enterobacteriaceae TaxID=543 RepID=UPI000CFBE33C|nr:MULTISPECIES: hypothetical protein [Enterobacteriaceae]MED0527973.1 hypothetical protein [Escherichia coli]TGH83838.1 hypothetical protein E5S39_13810 [Escherichia coli]
MVISQCLKCNLCSHIYRLRVGVGFDGYQKHYFDCSNCNANIVFALKAKAPEAHIEVVENCTLLWGVDEVEVMNFHPNCAFDKDDLHNPLSFPSIHLTQLISPHMRFIQGRMQSVANQFDIPFAPYKWSLIKGMMGTLHKDNVKANRFVQQYMQQRNKDMNVEIDGHPLSSEQVIVYESGVGYPEYYIIHEFFDSLFYPKITNIVRPIIDEIDKRDKSVFTDFLIYWNQELKEQNQYRYMNALSDYFRYRDHFGQIALYSRIDHDVDDLIVSSKGFDQIKLYYGDVYEALTSNMTILACLNNIMDGRKYDQFKTMSLSKYLEVNKANKANPFKDNVLFKAFAEDDLESSIRNGSHHASIWYDGEKVMYRSGGTGAQHDISYSRYLDLCNKLTIKLSAIWIIEYYLNLHVNGSGYFKFE